MKTAIIIQRPAIFANVKRSGMNASIPVKLLYVSTVDLYKHQWNVVSAVSELRKEGFDIKLTLVGSSYPKALEKLNALIDKVDKNKKFINYEGFIDNVNLPSIKLSIPSSRTNVLTIADKL